MNKYKVVFYFKKHWNVVSFTANQLANATLDHDDSILHFVFNNDGQDFETTIVINGEFYQVVFSSESPKCVNVYNTENNGGLLVEKNIPWLLLTVEDGNGEQLYNITQCI